jgi:hypothetical protein
MFVSKVISIYLQTPAWTLGNCSAVLSYITPDVQKIKIFLCGNKIIEIAKKIPKKTL